MRRWCSHESIDNAIMKAIGIDKAIMKAFSFDQNKNHNSIVLLIGADNSFVINGSEINGRLAFLLKMIKSYQKGAFEGKLNHNLCNIVEIPEGMFRI